MKLTKSQLKKIIKEELENVLKERDWSETPGIVGRGIAGLARKGLSRLLPAAQNAIALYKQYKDQPRQIAQSQEMQEWLPLIFGYPGFEEAADVANNAPSAEEIEAQKSEIKAQQSDTDRSRQEHGKPRYKENVAKLNAMKEKLSAAVEERNATRKQINDIVVAAYSEYPGLEKFLAKATMGASPGHERDYATGAALSLAKGDATSGEYYENKNMKLTKSQLKQIIKEELENVLKEKSKLETEEVKVCVREDTGFENIIVKPGTCGKVSKEKWNDKSVESVSFRHSGGSTTLHKKFLKLNPFR